MILFHLFKFGVVIFLQFFKFCVVISFKLFECRLQYFIFSSLVIQQVLQRL